MKRLKRLNVILMILTIWTMLPRYARAGAPPDKLAADRLAADRLAADDLTPDNTVILANWADARFSRDFSTLLKHLRLEWVILDSVPEASVPETVRDKNLILLGRPDDAYTGEIMRGLLAPDEIARSRAATDGQVIVKDSPWTAGRTIYLCTGPDRLATRDAAEAAVRSVMAQAPPASAWIQTTFDAPLDEDVRAYVDQLCFDWDDAELPLADLTMDLGAKPRRISAEQAAEDVAYLFYLFSHGYAGYAFFNQADAFEQAQARILAALPARSKWSSDDLTRLFYEHLNFIHDCHMRIGDQRYAGHADFWYDTRRLLTLREDGYQFSDGGTLYTLLSVNGGDPEPFVFPSLNVQGDPIYRLGTLSLTEPAPLQLVAAGDAGERAFEIALQRSDFAYYSDDLFREDDVGGIPVLRMRSFSDHHADALNRFVATASVHKGAPVLIVDLRGNEGGNEAWPIDWIQRLTGRRAEAVFIYAELNSKTSMSGRTNLQAYWYDMFPDTSFYRDAAERYASLAETFESGAREPYWTGPYYPQMPLIANDTTLIVVMNDGVASAGEGFVMRVSQAENVVLVGENTMGCLTFGNLGAHRLPHSRLMVQLPINFGLYLDMVFREGQGLAPDLWVPAADAVNYAVAAVRNGTLTTAQPLSPTTLQQDFVPEDPWARVRRKQILVGLGIALLAVGGGVWAYWQRHKPRDVAMTGMVWLVIGGIWIYLEIPPAPGLLIGGVVCLVSGGYNLWRQRRAAMQDTA